MKTISMVNNKGGVAKTSSVANIGACLSYMGNKVLLVDTDPQANLTQHFGYYDNIKSNLYDAYNAVISKEKDISPPLIKHNENLFIIPASGSLKDMEKLLVTQNANQTVLRKVLKPVQELFDFGIIDCPPSLGLLTDNAMAAADFVLMPVEAGIFSLNGIKSIVQHLNDLKTDLDLNYEILGVFMTKYDQRLGISEAVKTEVIKFFGDKFFDRVVRTNVAIADSQASGEDVFAYSRNSNAALDYGELTNQILNRIQYEKVS